MRNVLKVGGVIFGALVITALGIDAADTISGSRSTMLGQLIATEGGVCPEGMQELPTANTFTCFDVYEASTGEDCMIAAPNNEIDSLKNTQDSNCNAASKEGAQPWTYISREGAQTACMRAGKRLPTNDEWQLIAAGTPDTQKDCVIDGRAANRTGQSGTCVSASGAYDAVGNVWEWTRDDVFDGTYNGRVLPSEGYVAQVDAGGVATLTSTTSLQMFGDDYFWSNEKGAYAIMRGGYYGSQSDAGVYTAHAATLPTMTGAAIGFRCVQ